MQNDGTHCSSGGCLSPPLQSFYGRKTSNCNWAGQTVRYVNPNFFLLDQDGVKKAFDQQDISNESGRAYEAAICEILGGLPWRLETQQEQHSCDHLRECQQNVLCELKRTLPTFARRSFHGMDSPSAQIDAVVWTSLRSISEKLRNLHCTVHCGPDYVLPEASTVRAILIEACSDSRYVPAKLLQIERQATIVASGNSRLTREDRETQELSDAAFAVIFNRIAVYLNVEGMVYELGLTHCQQLLEEKRLLVAYCSFENLAGTLNEQLAEEAKKTRTLEEKTRTLEEKLAEEAKKTRALEEENRTLQQRLRQPQNRSLSLQRPQQKQTFYRREV